MGDPLRVLLIDDHPLLREGIIGLFHRDGRLRVVAQASEGKEGVEMTMIVHPDVVLLDVEMPGTPLATTLALLLRVKPSVTVIILTMHRDLALTRYLLAAGAAGVLYKTSSARQTIDDIVHIVSQGPQRTTDEQLPITRNSGITSREYQVLFLVAKGYTNSQVAAELQIAVGTVKRHTANIYSKLGARSRTDMVRIARLMNLLR